MKPSPKSAITAVKKSLRYAQSVNQEAKRRLYLKHGYKAMTHAIPVVYIDEIGFESSTERRFAWAPEANRWWVTSMTENVNARD